MKRLSMLIVLGSAMAGCSSTITLDQLKSGTYQGTVVKKSMETTSRMSTMGGQSQILWEHHYYLDVKDEAGMIQRLEVRHQAYNVVEEGAKLPLEDRPSK